MASKRRIVVRRSEEETERPRQLLNDRDIMMEGTWNEWFQRVFLKYCYVLGVLFLACLAPLEALRLIEGALGIGVAFISVLVIVPLGILGYLKVWGENGLWGPESQEDE